MFAPALRVALVLSCLATLSAADSAPATLVFPSVQADTLARQTLHLPVDFGAGNSLILVAFERDQQKDLDTWAGPEAALSNARSTFRFYDLPVLPWRDKFYRWWLNTAMRSGIPDDAARRRTIPIYVDKERFKSALQITTEKAITALLIDKDGRVLWRSSGAWTEEKQRALVYALAHS